MQPYKVRSSFGVPRNLQPQSDPPLALFRRQGMSVSVPPRDLHIWPINQNVPVFWVWHIIWSQVPILIQFEQPTKWSEGGICLLIYLDYIWVWSEAKRSIILSQKCWDQSYSVKTISFLISLCLMVACRFIWITFELDKSERDQSFHLITPQDQSS